MVNEETIGVFLAYHHEIYRTWFRRICESDHRLTLVGEATTADEALEHMPRAGVDVAVIELGLDRRNGNDLPANMAATLPKVHCVVVSSAPDGTTVDDAIAAEAIAWPPRQMSSDALIGSIRAEAGGGSLLTPAQNRQLMQHPELHRVSPRRCFDRLDGDAANKDRAETGDRQRVLYSAIDSEDERPTDGRTHTLESPGLAWKMEPELELSIDVETMPVTVRMIGTLHSQAGKSVRSVIEELVHEGYRDFAMQVEGLQLPDPTEFSSLVGIQRLIKSVGGSIRWSHWREPTG